MVEIVKKIAEHTHGYAQIQEFIIRLRIHVIITVQIIEEGTSVYSTATVAAAYTGGTGVGTRIITGLAKDWKRLKVQKGKAFGT